MECQHFTPAIPILRLTIIVYRVVHLNRPDSEISRLFLMIQKNVSNQNGRGMYFGHVSFF